MKNKLDWGKSVNQESRWGLFQHFQNEMVVAKRGKMRRSRCVLKLKCRRLDGLDVVGKNTGRVKDYA